MTDPMRRAFALMLGLIVASHSTLSHAVEPATQLRLQLDHARPIVLDLSLLQAHATESIDVQWTRSGTVEKFKFAGARVRSLLSLLNVPSGAELRGRWLRYVVTAVGADGYSVSFGLGELEPTLGGQRAIVAWQRDGAGFAAGSTNDGQLRLVVEGDGRPSRSVRELVELRVFDPLTRISDRQPPSLKTP